MAPLSLFFVLLATPLIAARTLKEPILPSDESARLNANRIFNAIHSAGRQWGSSLNHNGFGFIPTVMAAGTLLYHGGSDDKIPSGPEWLAFEMEHSEYFAMSWRTLPRRPGALFPDEHDSQKPLMRADDGNVRGYLHTYQATRDLQLLYIDGMSAGKTTIGTLDSQDLVLRGNKTDKSKDGDFLGEWARANSICDLIKKWGFDGVIRTEMGLEVIYCDFSSGLRQDSVLRTFFEEDKIGTSKNDFFEWSRAAGGNYDGIAGDRVRMDFSSMVSGFFFPITMSSTDPQRPDLVRLGAAKLDELQDILAYLREVSIEPRRFTVNWQAVVDMVVNRYSDRIAVLLSEKVSNYFIHEVEGITLAYYDAPSEKGDINHAANPMNRTSDAVDRCIKHYLKPALLKQDTWSPQDVLIHHALKSVMQNICHTFFLVRSAIIEASHDSSPDTYRIHIDANNKDLDEAVIKSREMVRDLATNLSWTTWKKPRLCPEGETLFVAMWPFGDEEDFWNPGCRSIDELRSGRSSYWRKYR